MYFRYQPRGLSNAVFSIDTVAVTVKKDVKDHLRGLVSISVKDFDVYLHVHKSF